MFTDLADYTGRVSRSNQNGLRKIMCRGQTDELGRSPGSAGLAFPNRPGQDNINWSTGERAAKAGADGFTLDRVLAGEQ